MVDVISGKTNLTNILRKTYKKLGKGWVTLLQIPSEMHMQANSEAIRILISELNYSCVYVTLSKSCGDLSKTFKTAGLDTSKIYFIDAISQMYGIGKTDTKNCKYVSGPLDIDAITATLRETLASIPSEKKCVFLDSVTTVLLYNSLPRTVRFSKFLTQTLKKIGVDGVMVSIAKGSTTQKLIKELGKLCDEVIDISGGGRSN